MNVLLECIVCIHRACSNCQWQLPLSLLSEDEVIKLRLHVTDMISRKVASLSSSRHEMMEIRNLNELICSKLPIHYVMDGANVGYIGDQTFSFDKVSYKNVVHIIVSK